MKEDENSDNTPFHAETKRTKDVCLVFCVVLRKHLTTWRKIRKVIKEVIKGVIEEVIMEVEDSLKMMKNEGKDELRHQRLGCFA